MQTPTWVTLVVAFFGLIGILGGQVINAWRDKQRSREETERERIRLQHDQDLEEQRRSHDLAQKWLADKIDVYTKLLASMEKIEDACYHLGTHETLRKIQKMIHQRNPTEGTAADLESLTDLCRRESDQLKSIYQDHQVLLNELAFLGSDQAIRAATIRTAMWLPAEYSDTIWKNHRELRENLTLSDMTDQSSDLLSIIRKELGLGIAPSE